MEIIFWLCFSVLLYIYLGYPLFLLLIGTFVRRSTKVDEQYTPMVTLIIPAYNEEECIAEKIENSLALNYPGEKLQIIVSSDNSSDATPAIAARYASQYSARMVFNDFKDRSGKMGILNKSVPMAEGEIVVFTDANAMYDQNAIRNLVRHFADPTVGCVSGAKVITDKKIQTGTGEGLYWRLEAWTKGRESRISSCAGADGAVYAIRKDLYPYPDDKALVMDDFIISLRIVEKGYRCIFDPEVKAFEDSSVNLLDEFRRKGRIFAGALGVLVQMPQILLPWNYGIFIQLWSHKVLRWMTIFFLAGMYFSNIFLAAEPTYMWLLFAQTVFHSLAVIGFGLAISGIKNKVCYIPFYFDFMALTQLFGIVQFYKNKYKPAWEKLQR